MLCEVNWDKRLILIEKVDKTKSVLAVDELTTILFLRLGSGASEKADQLRRQWKREQR